MSIGTLTGGDILKWEGSLPKGSMDPSNLCVDQMYFHPPCHQMKVLNMTPVTHRIHVTGISTYMNG